MKHVIILYATMVVCAHTSFTPQEVMVDVTNDFGVCILQLVSSRRENVAFSPYGVVSVGLVLYEGASGTTAAEIHNTLRLPWDRHITRIGFRDLHRYLKSYFTNDGFLRGLVLSKPNVVLHWNYTRQLQFYGFDLKPADKPTKIPSTDQTTPMEETTKPSTTTEGTTVISTQQPTTTVTMPQETEKQPETENASKSPTTTQRTDAPDSDEETLQTEKMPVPTPTNRPTVSTVTTNTEAQETVTSKAPVTSTSAAKTDTTDEETQETKEVTTGVQTSPSTTDSITADGDNQQTEEVSRVTQTNSPTTNAVTTNVETQQTEEASKATTELVNTQKEESSVTETKVTSAVTETTKPESTMAQTEETKVDMEGRADSEDSPESTTQTKVPTTRESTEKTEITSVSPIMPSTSQISTENVPEATSIPDTTKTESNEDKTASEATVASSNPMSPPTTQTSASTIAEEKTKQVTEPRTTLTDSARSETTKTETQPPTESSTTITQPSPTVVSTTSASTISSPTNTETETSNEINTQQTTSGTEAPNTEGTSRKRRALQSKGLAPEHREGVSNWVPHYQDPRWNYHAPLENWFFSYLGGEKVPIITYSAYLPFAYLGDLATLALQLPLDDPRYYMLILLPQERNGLEKLLYSLQWCPIRGIINQLKLTAVYATVPVFTIVKHVNLVPALAKLGILSVFDPSTADLSAMSPEKGIFVRTIEQVVTVSLRKYFANYRWFEAKPNEVEQHFIANHPFAYFVLDKETQVTLMTGTIVNPTAYNQ